MNKMLRPLLLCGISLHLCAFVSFGAITIQFLSTGASRSVGSIVRQGELWVAVPHFFEQFGYSWQWDETTQQLTCLKNSSSYIFSRDIPQYSGPSGLCRLPAAPMRIGPSLYVPFGALLDIGGTLCNGSVRWDAARQVLTVNQSLFTIASVNVEKKEKSIIVSIGLADSTRFDCMYVHPNVTITFFGATIDTGRIKNYRKIGCLDSLSSVQTKESAQLSLVVGQEVEEPQVDYLEDQRIVLMTLKHRPEKPVSPRPHQEAVSAAIKSIMIDPGHGGKDPGAVGPGGAREKNITLAIALELRDLFKQYKDIKTFLTRDKDIFVPLADRTKMANERNADLFVSIHANATSGSNKKKETTRGYKVYFLSQAKNEDDKLAAMRENAVIELEERPQNYNGLQNVLIDLAGNEYLRESQDLSILLDQQFEAELGKKISRQARGIGQANFWVLNGAYMPSILIETGFISNRSEEKMLLSKQFQKKMAAAVFGALLRFKKNYETGL